MKKVMVVMTIVSALFFLVSMIAVSPSVAAKVTQTQPTSKQQTQQGTIQTPAKQGIPAGFKPTAYEKAKEKFWDLEFDRLEIKGHIFKSGSHDNNITVKAGEKLTFKYFYKVKTIPINDITEADAKAWGKGKAYKNYLFLRYVITPTTPATPDGCIAGNFYLNKSLPKFTWQDVLNWKKMLGGPKFQKTWQEEQIFNWTACTGGSEAEVQNSFYLDTTDFNDIPETNEDNNGTLSNFLWIKVTP